MHETPVAAGPRRRHVLRPSLVTVVTLFAVLTVLTVLTTGPASAQPAPTSSTGRCWAIGPR